MESIHQKVSQIMSGGEMVVNVLPPENQPLLYSVTDAAAMLGISRSSLYNEIKSNSIVIVKIKSRTLIPHSAMQRYVTRLEERAFEELNARGWERR